MSKKQKKQKQSAHTEEETGPPRAQRYRGYLGLDWYKKERAILMVGESDMKRDTDEPIPGPRLHWVNEDGALFYEIEESEGKGKRPYWVDRNDIRVKEPRPLIHQKTFVAEEKKKQGTLLESEFVVKESKLRDDAIPNILIKGDNLLALNTLVKMFENRPEEEKIKCIYIDPPYNTGSAFEHYEDSLAHSQWLSMVRDRLLLLKRILARRGAIYVSINALELSYLSALMDEIFGRTNRLPLVTLQAGTTASYRSINECPVNVSEYVLGYGSEEFVPNSVWVPAGYSEDYSHFIANIDESPKGWALQTLDEIIHQQEGCADWRAFKKKFGVRWKDARFERKADFALSHKNQVVSLNTLQKPSETVQKMIDASRTHRNQVHVLQRDNAEPIYAYNGRTLAFFGKKFRDIGGTLMPAQILTNLWNDISFLGIGPEGSVSLPNGKKPEALVARILELATAPGDLVLDCFAGSGTTLAVAAKLRRRYIGVEIGAHADTHIIPRLTAVISADDQTGISDMVEWRGGGAFQYFHLGASILSKGGKDFNWSLGIEHVSESLLYYFDFTRDETIALSGMVVGFDRRTESAGIVCVRDPKTDHNMLIGELEITNAVKEARKKYGECPVKFITNCGHQIPGVLESVQSVSVPSEIVADLD